MKNPVQIVLESLSDANAKSIDPRMTFINLLTAAVVAGKIIGLSQQEIRRKLKEVEHPANTIHKNVVEKLK
jgi:hypothetical protein